MLQLLLICLTLQYQKYAVKILLLKQQEDTFGDSLDI